jgi:hypothetical protein
MSLHLPTIEPPPDAADDVFFGTGQR